jgi:hypothetical protein
VNKTLSSAFLSLLLLSMLLTFSWEVPVHAAPSWNVQIVDEDASGIGYGYCPIAVDSEDNPHIAYSGSPEARYASWNGSGWNIQQIPSYAFVHDLALDANGDPHITLGSLAYGTWNGTGWNFQTVTTDYTVYSSLALDSSGNPHVAYITGDKLKYASQNGSNWTIQTVTVDNNLTGIDVRLSLVIDSSDTPYIMYNTFSSYVDSSIGGARNVNVELAVWKNSRWTIETVLESSNLGEFGNMVLDSNDHPHFLATKRRYLSAENPTLLSTILYVSWDGWAWNIQTVASDVNLHDIGFLALSPHGYPSIVYIAGGVKYARWTGTAWESYNVKAPFTIRDASGPCYLALDSKGIPHISSRVFLSGQILYPGYTSTILYATANLTEPAEVSPAFPLLIVSAAIIIGTVIAVVAYVWKKKTKH